MKVNLELNMPDDRVFLNFWDAIYADDVVCQIIDGRLMLSECDENNNELPPREISIDEFVSMVKTRMETIIRNKGTW